MLLEPDWPAPANVRALTTLRGSDPAAEIARIFSAAEVLSLRQVHGATVVDASLAEAGERADSAFSRCAGVPCRVRTADCLPVLICNRQGTEVAAVHAGWRGLAAGVLENTLDRLHSEPGQLLVWLGPAISRAHYEVGAEVRAALLGNVPAELAARLATAFVPRGGRFLADLPALAHLRLEWLGITRVYGGCYCTFAEGGRFCSWRRDRNDERMHSVIVFT